MTGSRAEFTLWRSVVDIVGSLAEALRDLRAEERAFRVAAFYRSGFERTKHGATDALKSRIRGHIVQRDLALIGDRSDAEDAVTLDGDQE
jgi:hypothetical protein